VRTPPAPADILIRRNRTLLAEAEAACRRRRHIAMRAVTTRIEGQHIREQAKVFRTSLSVRKPR
jgi:hypothetical protein